MLVGNATVITCDPAQPVVRHGAVAVTGDKVVQVGPEAELRRRWPDARFEDAGGRLLMPGMTCTHTHLYSTFARGMALSRPAARCFREILERLWWRLDRALTEEDVGVSAAVALVQCVKCGTTTIMDHHSSPNAIDGSLDIIGEAVEKVGIRASLAYEVSDRDGPKARDAGIAENVRFIKECERRPTARIRATFGLHASFTLSDETLERCAEAGHALGAGFHVHTAEGPEDQALTLGSSGLRVVERFDRFGLWGPRSLAIHCVHVDHGEMEILRARGAAVVHNPQSNMGNAVGAAPVLEMARRGMLVGLGTDGYAMDMFESLRTANLLAKHVAGDPQAGWVEARRMAFENNTAILARHWEAPLGVLAPGAYADMIAVDYDPPTPLTEANWFSHVLFGLPGAAVNTTIVGGQVLMRDGELLTVDERELAARARELAAALWNRI
ncbi:MAG: putative aminohydrolase SsnA [Firmicutes bacterium]|nr:putative aminohydrolase SsnA [Bacillota bacterium]